MIIVKKFLNLNFNCAIRYITSMKANKSYHPSIIEGNTTPRLPSLIQNGYEPTMPKSIIRRKKGYFKTA